MHWCSAQKMKTPSLSLLIACSILFIYIWTCGHAYVYVYIIRLSTTVFLYMYIIYYYIVYINIYILRELSHSYYYYYFPVYLGRCMRRYHYCMVDGRRRLNRIRRSLDKNNNKDHQYSPQYLTFFIIIIILFSISDRRHQTELPEFYFFLLYINNDEIYWVYSLYVWVHHGNLNALIYTRVFFKAKALIVHFPSNP